MHEESISGAMESTTSCNNCPNTADQLTGSPDQDGWHLVLLQNEKLNPTTQCYEIILDPKFYCAAAICQTGKRTTRVPINTRTTIYVPLNATLFVSPLNPTEAARRTIQAVITRALPPN